MVSRKQAQKLGLKARVRLSPLLEKSCLLLSANVSYENAERDLKLLTGIAVSHSTQQRLVILGANGKLLKRVKQLRH